MGVAEEVSVMVLWSKRNCVIVPVHPPPRTRPKTVLPPGVREGKPRNPIELGRAPGTEGKICSTGRHRTSTNGGTSKRDTFR